MIEFIKKYTVYPIEDNAKMAAFVALGAGYLEGKFGPTVGFCKFVVGLIS